MNSNERHSFQQTLTAIGLVFSILFLTGCPLETREPAVQTDPPLYEVLGYSGKSDPIFFAHRGGPGAGYPENAIETFERTF